MKLIVEWPLPILIVKTYLIPDQFLLTLKSGFPVAVHFISVTSCSLGNSINCYGKVVPVLN